MFGLTKARKKIRKKQKVIEQVKSKKGKKVTAQKDVKAKLNKVII